MVKSFIISIILGGGESRQLLLVGVAQRRGKSNVKPYKSVTLRTEIDPSVLFFVLSSIIVFGLQNSW